MKKTSINKTSINTKLSLIFSGEIPDIMDIILMFLDLPDLIKQMTTSKHFNRIIRTLPVNFFGYNYPENISLDLMRTFPRLQSITLGQTAYQSLNISDKQFFFNFPHLQQIHLDVATESFIGLPNLKSLRVNSVMNLDKNIKLLPNKDNLKMLAIDCLNRRSDELYDGEHLSDIMPNLETLHVRYRDFTDNFYHNFRGLIELCLVWCNEITDEAFRDLPNLERLYMRNTSIGDDAFRYIPQLKLLHFEDCFGLTNKAFQHLTQLECLKIPYLSSTQGITDDAFIHLGNLKELRLPAMHDDSADQNSFTVGIFKYLPNLKRLDLSGSNLLGPELFKVLYQKFDWLNICQLSRKPFKMTRKIFLKLYVKELYIDETYVRMTRDDLNCLVKNGLKHLSFVIDRYFTDSRFSPIIYNNKTFDAKNARNYFRWTVKFIKKKRAELDMIRMEYIAF